MQSSQSVTCVATSTERESPATGCQSNLPPFLFAVHLWNARADLQTRAARSFSTLLKTIWIVGLFLSSVLIGFPPTVLAFQARINKPVVEESLVPGQAASGTIEVENQGEGPLIVDVYLQDWEYLEGGSGDKLFSAPGTSPWSASNWINYYPKKLELPGHGKGFVEYTIQVPSGAVGGHYAVLFFESMLGAAAKNEQGVTVQYTGRLGSLFEIESAGSVERAGAISRFTLGRPDEDRPLSLSYTFNNTGNVAIRPKAYFNITDGTGRYFGRGEFKPLYTFPGRSGSTATEWTGALAPGEYTVLLTVSLGGTTSDVLVAEQPLQVMRGGLVIEQVTLSASTPAKAVVTVQNTGNVRISASGTLALQTEAGAALTTWPIGQTTMAPQERVNISVAGSGSAPTGAAQCRVQLRGEGVSVELAVPCRRE